MVTLYGQIFGETYKAHLGRITSALNDVEDRLGEDARTALGNRIAANADAVAKWAGYVALSVELPDVSKVSREVADAHGAAKALLDRKRSAPLDVIEALDELGSVSGLLGSVGDLLREYNAAVEAINEATKKAVAAVPTTESAALLARSNVQKRIARHDPGVQKRVDAYLAAKRRDQRAREMRTLVQKRLKKDNEDAAAHYHQRVNHYLGRFSATFTISKITNSMQGNAGQADYGLLIKGETISRGR